MDPKREQELLAQVREYLLQIALELEAAAAAARKAADLVPQRNAAMPYVHQLYSRLGEANFQLGRLKTTIDAAVANSQA